ncbi:HAD family phosphatase [Microbaculum marinum]|uniref:HAD family phosphatase n=1 Tax=Microbaculum marinum TaxID=1764581 RepID=A0AAW9RXF1_9HYPH
MDALVRPQAVVFDVGNVLLDWDPAYLFDTLISTAEERDWFLTHVATLGWHSMQDRGRSCAEGVADLTRRFPGSARLIEAYYERWLDTIGGTIEGSVEIMSRLRAAGVPVHTITNFSAELWPMTVEAYPFLADFDIAVVSGEVGYIKPDPRIFDVLLSRSGMSAASMVFIDDRADNVEAAAQLGFHALRFTTPEALAEDLAALGFPASAAATDPAVQA